MNRYAQASRLFIALLFALIGMVSPLSPMAALASAAPVAPFDWQLTVGASSADQAVQANFFIPRQVWIHVNDRVTWTWKSGEIHTVSFLSGQPPAFPPFAPFGGTPDSATYSGSGQVSSGIHTALPVPPQFQPPFTSTYTVEFTRAGNYTFNCLVHNTMWGVVHVRPLGQLLPHNQAFYSAQATSGASRLLNEGQQIFAEGLHIALSQGPNQVQAGYGELEDTGSFAILRFQPDGVNQPLTVKVGQTVTWTNRDPETPHTVTFNKDYPNPEDSAVPFGLDSGNAVPGHATMANTTTSVNSGFIGVTPNAPVRGTTFSVTFNSAGTYDYHCELHDNLGMKGQVIVTP